WPFVGAGDGRVDLGDFLAAGILAGTPIAFIPNASGPAYPIPPGPRAAPEARTKPRAIRIAKADVAGSRVTVAIEMDARPQDKGVSFTLNYDAKKLSIAGSDQVRVGRGADGGVLVANTGEPGKVGIVLGSLHGFVGDGSYQEVVSI